LIQRFGSADPDQNITDLQHNDDLDPVAIRHFSVIPSKKTGFNSSLFVSKRRLISSPPLQGLNQQRCMNFEKPHPMAPNYHENFMGDTVFNFDSL
jgi:hypothetical protein